MKSKIIVAALAATAINMAFTSVQAADEAEALAQCMKAAELGKEDEPSLDPEAFCHDKDRVLDLAGTDWACIINQLETNSELQGIGEAMNECN
jgi:hypothetical protein